MATTESRIVALEQAKGDRIEIVRVNPDGVARDSNGNHMPPGWDKCKGVITIVRSYGAKQ
jgi:hypothetical protein